MTEFIHSVAFKRFVGTLFLGLALALFTYSLGYLPQDDLLQGIWVFLSTTVSGYLIFRKQSSRFEESEDRYRRFARESLEIQMERDAHLVSTLLSGRDAPALWAAWINELYGINFFQCRSLHAIDSLFHAGDLPGQGITRATKWFGDVLKGLEGATQEEREDTVSRALEKFVEESRNLLGEQYEEGYYFCVINSGPLPYGIFMESGHKGVKALATTYKHSLYKKGKVEEIHGCRLGLNLKGMTEECWEEVVRKIDGLFPWFDRKNLGDGPRSWTSQLFVQEAQNVSPLEFREKLKELPGLLKEYEK